VTFNLPMTAPAVAALAALAGAMLLPSAALAQKEQFVRSKPHVNVRTLPAGPSNHLLAPNVHWPEPEQPTVSPLGTKQATPQNPSRR
jgi:hypothetical protein